MGKGPGSNEAGVLFTLEIAKISRFFKLEKFSKNVKKSMKNYNFWEIFKESLRFFEIFKKVIEIFAKI